MNLEEYQIILASASPRRKELLAQMGLSFLICPAKGEEHAEADAPAAIVEELSRKKAEEVFQSVLAEDLLKKKPLVIGADTVVALDEKILGKPKDAGEAREMLSRLSGKKHQVFTGVTLMTQDGYQVRQKSFSVCTDVHFCTLTEDEIVAYVATGDPMDKAGAYGIQSGAGIFVEGISGDYNNVVGLPIARLYQELKEFTR